MPNSLLASHYYRNLGGVNLKSSEYTLEKTEFLNLRNVDFDVPNALQKRPGSTQAISTNTSGPIIGLFEYIQLTGSSWLIAGSDTALFYRAANNLTLLDAGWTNGQPQDMLTFVNRAWIANGQNYKWWDGGISYGIQPVGLPQQRTELNVAGTPFNSTNGVTTFLVAGATHVAKTAGVTFIARGVYVAYSYVRNDGYIGPADFLANAKNIITTDTSVEGMEWFTQPSFKILKGFTIPSGYGISAVQLWVAVDTVTNTSSIEPQLGGPGSTLNGQYVGELGWRQRVGIGFNFMSVTLKPDANLRKFILYTTIPGSSLFVTSQFSPPGGSAYAASFALTTSDGASLRFFDYDGEASGGRAFSGMPFAWFDTNTPKYIEVNQNVMFMSGFSNTPSVMWHTEIGEPENIQPEYNFEIRTNDGDRISGHRAYNGNVIAFKTNSFCKIIGTNPDDFDLVELSTEFGLVSNNALVEYNEKLLWLDKKGIVQYDGANWRVISDGLDDVFRSMNLNAAYEKAVGVHNHYRNQVWFGIPVNGSTQNNLTVVYDYLVDGWTFFDGFNASSFAWVKSELTKPTVWRGSNSGMIYYYGESFFGDNGQGISCVTFSRFDQFQGENSSSVWRRLFLDVSPVTGLTGVITGKIYRDYDKSTVRATFTMYQSQFQSRAEMGVVGKAMAFEAGHHSASLPFLMNGYTWAKRFLRNV